ncbi:unknown [Prevotella sp. CAG:1031]|nr:unknown [Prevotella sp. CAG:1031]
MQIYNKFSGHASCGGGWGATDRDRLRTMVSSFHSIFTNFAKLNGADVGIL